MKNNNIHQGFIKFVNTLTDRPAMFQINNVEDLGLVIFGYQSGCQSYSDESVVLNKMLGSFREFVNKEFNMKENYDWVRIIRFHSEGDRGSIELFRLLFSKFIER